MKLSTVINLPQTAKCMTVKILLSMQSLFNCLTIVMILNKRPRPDQTNNIYRTFSYILSSFERMKLIFKTHLLSLQIMHYKQETLKVLQQIRCTCRFNSFYPPAISVRKCCSFIISIIVNTTRPSLQKFFFGSTSSVHNVQQRTITISFLIMTSVYTS